MIDSHRNVGVPHWDADCARCGHELADKLVSEGVISRIDAMMQPMWLCPLCGNKRCPKAAFHGYKCNRSNEWGQEVELEEGYE